MEILTQPQKQQWLEQGYLVLKEVLSADEVQKLVATVDEMDAAFRQGEDINADTVFDKRNVMEDNDIFVALMEHPITFPVVLELLGPYIQLSMSEVIVRPPNPKDKGYLHTDGGQAMRGIRVSETSWPLQVKIHYFLTALDNPDSGNFTVVPGSHNRPFPEEGVPEGPNIADAVILRCSWPLQRASLGIPSHPPPTDEPSHWYLPCGSVLRARTYTDMYDIRVANARKYVRFPLQGRRLGCGQDVCANQICRR